MVFFTLVESRRYSFLKLEEEFAVCLFMNAYIVLLLDVRAFLAGKQRVCVVRINSL